MLEYETEARNTFNSLNNYFNIDNKQRENTKKKIDELSKGIVYLLLGLGVPKQKLELVICNSLKYCTSQEIKREFEKKKRKLKENGKCAVCGSTKNLTVHHLKPTGRGYGYLKYNPGNWIVLCRECHEDLHNRLGV